METYKENDKQVFCFAAKSFPDGVLEAHQKLHSMYPPDTEREYYGISWMNNGKIIYKAAVWLKNSEEAEKSNLESFIIRKGKYTGEIIENFMEDISSIGRTFQQLLNNPQVDPLGYCLEEYFNLKDVKCLVKLKDE